MAYTNTVYAHSLINNNSINIVTGRECGNRYTYFTYKLRTYRSVYDPKNNQCPVNVFRILCTSYDYHNNVPNVKSRFLAYSHVRI